MHEEASSTASSSTKPTNIIYTNINGGGVLSGGGGVTHLNGNLLITTTPTVQDASSSLYELVHHQHHHQQQPSFQQQHHQQVMTTTQPLHSTKIIITNQPLISTTTATSPAGVRTLQHHMQHQPQNQHHHVQSTSSCSSSSGPTSSGTTTILINTDDGCSAFDTVAAAAAAIFESDPGGPSAEVLTADTAVAAAAAALIDLHPSSSCSSAASAPTADGTLHIQELGIASTTVAGTTTSTSSSTSASSSTVADLGAVGAGGVALHEPIEIKIPSEGSFAEGSDGGYHDNISQTQSNYLAIPPSELCPVCGDKVSGYHYGLLTCESCKGFFKRTVQNKKVYTCVAERQCHIDKTQRKRCPYCRFQKCLEVGMKLEAVRADRMRGGRNKFGPMYKRDRARKLQIMRQRQLAIQALRGSIGGGVGIGQLGSDGASAQLQGIDYHQPYSNMHIKQEIQIPQVSSLTSSPDSSPSPIAIALGQVNPQTTISLSSGVGGNGSSGGGSGGGGSNNSSGAGTGGSNSTSTAIQNQLSESKLWMSANSTTASPHSLSPKAFSFDSGTNPTSTADSGNPADTLRVSPMIRDFVQSIDDREWQTSLFSLLQSQSYNQCEVDLFELMCKVLDQNLFSQVDWARNTIFFKDLKVDDQMKLLQNSWSDMLVLDHIHQRLHNGLPDETTLHNGQKFDLLGLGLLGVPSLAEHFNELQNKLQELKFDVGDYICMKFLLLLNPVEVRGITNRKTVVEGYENVQAALLDYTLTCYPSVPDKFSKLLSIIPEIHAMATRGEEHLYIKHCAGSAPSQTLLMEMLHAKRK
ncbi:nuclear hormone receptor FTZ-F1 isoform X2 [Aedes aegypti]|uniref:Nuclear hormone receptor FTZ-F1 n=1 Tax=Aedes aegypti TaxID=7159 RepID=A0A6I8TXB3_AEDAE|nr:nuclear hormone receptor FTZ-F1 isoform X2 [Aedes aegypti]XP_021697815.1 nuclear hormone receptor FTZ-F1 isoform X2 [Aedes aegypti]XP_021697816.1 nuclear hormone receptor FTZ-F1 isoform X2 [Aedes aegypti]